MSIGYSPPVDGLPMKIVMLLFAVISVFITVGIGLMRMRKAKQKQKLHPKNIRQKIFHTNDGGKAAFTHSEIFDSDADTIIVDNSANCIIWKYKKNFVKSSYRELGAASHLNIETASGDRNPVSMGDLNIGWYDDNGQYHSFVLKDVFHVPASLVNVLGLSAFSKSIGDYDTRGTRIDSSGQESIFSWDNNTYRRSFSHSDANMPELSVNDGYAKYHRFCNFVESIQPISKQCYHVKKKSELNVINNIPYDVGEDIVYKNLITLKRV